jgi:multicomponent Na+:H+ antiporter subunit C
MNTLVAYSSTGVLLFCLGLYGVFFAGPLLRRLMAMNIMAVGVFLVLIAIARRNASLYPDPVPHAMLLTGIVVAISATAFAVGLARAYYRASGETDLEDGGSS